MHAQHWFWFLGGAALLTAVLAGIADHRRTNRHDLDRIGWVPWRGIQVTAVFVLLVDLILIGKL